MFLGILDFNFFKHPEYLDGSEEDWFYGLNCTRPKVCFLCTENARETFKVSGISL